MSRQIPPSEIVQQDTTVKDHAQPDLPEEVELQPEKAPSELKEQKPQRDKPTGETDLLQQMLRELRNLNRQQRFKEFSVLKLLAGMVQMVVILCLIFAVFIGTGLEERNETVHTCLLLALVFQVMVLSLLVMHKS